MLTLPAEKQAVRPLYEQVFSEDSIRYVDYYFREKCRDNIIFIKECRLEDGWHILSTVHLNPYTLSVCGQSVRTYMIAAVSTDPAHRGEGHMRDVLRASLAYLAEQDIPFTYLLPVDEAIYAPFGFETVCPFTAPESVPAQPENEYDIFLLPDAVTKERLRMEAQIEKEDAQDAPESTEKSLLPERPVIMAKITSAGAFDRITDCAHKNDAARLAYLRGRKICIYTEV